MPQTPENSSESSKIIRALAIQARITQFHTNILVDLRDERLNSGELFQKLRQNQGKIGKLCRELESLAKQS